MTEATAHNQADEQQASQDFLRKSLAAEQKVLKEQLALTAQSIKHSTTKGMVTEEHFISFLHRSLPRRYAVSSGFVIDHHGSISDQIDIIISDPQYSPVLLDQKSHRYIPAEAVYGVLEVKQRMDKEHMDYAAKKAKSVRKLNRTSEKFRHIGGTSEKEHFPILAGIVTVKATWGGGLNSNGFRSCQAQLSQDEGTRLDCGLVLNDLSFDTFDPNKGLTLSPNTENSLAFFIFRLLSKLQSMGTAPAANWQAYAQTISQQQADDTNTGEVVAVTA